MKKITFNTFSLLLIGFLMLSCTKDDVEELYKTESEVVVDIKLSYSEIEQDIINLVNDHRVANGLPVLSVLNLISKEAIDHTNYMIKNGEISHDNFSTRHQNLVINANARSVAENVAYGYKTSQGVVNGWLNSNGHKKNIENKEFTHIGISMKKDDLGNPYYTNIFIKK